MILELPWPPTVNTYWRRHGHTIHISNRGREYRKSVAASLIANGRGVSTGRDGQYPIPLRGRLKVTFEACPPDRRKRDIDNLLKSAIDSLTHAGAWEDDEQIDDLRIVRGEIVKGGSLVVEVTELKQERPDDRE